jgi:type IV pilus assembly protein PilB
VAQRLIRLLCPACKTGADFNVKLYPDQFKAPYVLDRHFISAGCDLCYQTGFKGRKAVYEVISIDQQLSTLIKTGTHEVEQVLAERGISTLAENAFELFAAGETSLEEIYPLLLN